MIDIKIHELNSPFERCVYEVSFSHLFLNYRLTACKTLICGNMLTTYKTQMKPIKKTAQKLTPFTIHHKNSHYSCWLPSQHLASQQIHTANVPVPHVPNLTVEFPVKPQTKTPHLITGTSNVNQPTNPT